MRQALGTYQPASNWITAVLLTIFVTGFGLVAQYRIDAGHAMIASQADLTATAPRSK